MVFIVFNTSIAMELNLSNPQSLLKVITEKDVSEGFGRGLPMGPASARFFKDNIWFVDSITGNFIELASSGKLLSKFSVAKGSKYIFHDFDFMLSDKNEISAIWAIGSEETNILKIGLDGKVIHEFATKLSIPSQLEIINNKTILIFDEGEMKIFAFDLKGKKLWQQECNGKNFLVNAEKKIIFLKKEKEEIKVCTRSIENDKIEIIRSFPIAEESHPQLLGMTAKGEIYFAFHSTSEKNDKYNFMIGRLTSEKPEIEVVEAEFPASFLKRFFIQKDGSIFLLNYVENIKGKFLKLTEFDFDSLVPKTEG